MLAVMTAALARIGHHRTRPCLNHLRVFDDERGEAFQSFLPQHPLFDKELDCENTLYLEVEFTPPTGKVLIYGLLDMPKIKL